ncbi:MAG: chemotaxis protein CheW, partial [Cyclobacteriaceae bacterium]|nr:chemotaxis protein CheW [Cyclobacteriaceae bacterium]
KAYHSGVNVYIHIQDDGNGIDPKIIRNRAIEKGLIQESDTLSEKQILELIFAPGFSTAKKVTDDSGRGVGLDVIKKNISDIRGDISIESIPDKGSSFIMKLPLTLSITDGLLVKIADIFYLIPLNVVNKCYEIKRKDIKKNLNKSITLEGEQIPLLHLRDEFGIKSKAPVFFQLIVVENENRKVGLTVDVIIGEYQAVLKPLGKYYKHQDFISGGTILGDGTIALVMNTDKIINQFSNHIIEDLA